MGTPPNQNELVPPTQKSTHEGNTISNYNEGDTLKKYNTVNVIKTNLDSEVLQIYNEYPRKVGKLAALKAIEKAMATSVFAELLNATTAYRNATNCWSTEKQSFIPHPTTWFNQGRYLDDPKTWEATGKDFVRQESPEHLERLKAF